MRDVGGAARTLALDLLALALPVACVGCERDGRPLCDSCRRVLDRPVDSRLLQGEAGALRVVSGLEYDGVARTVLLAFKNGGRTDLRGPLARALRSAVLTALEPVEAEGVLLVPMPRTRRSARERGYDPTVVLLKAARLPHRRALAAARIGLDQAGLGRAGRFVNAAGSMRASAAAAGRPVRRVDDVVTTGATLLEAARAVTTAGGRVVGAATVASTGRRTDAVRALSRSRGSEGATGRSAA